MLMSSKVKSNDVLSVHTGHLRLFSGLLMTTLSIVSDQGLNHPINSRTHCSRNHSTTRVKQNGLYAQRTLSTVGRNVVTLGAGINARTRRLENGRGTVLRSIFNGGKATINGNKRRRGLHLRINQRAKRQGHLSISQLSALNAIRVSTVLSTLTISARGLRLLRRRTRIGKTGTHSVSATVINRRHANGSGNANLSTITRRTVNGKVRLFRTFSHRSKHANTGGLNTRLIRRIDRVSSLKLTNNVISGHNTLYTRENRSRILNHASTNRLRHSNNATRALKHVDISMAINNVRLGTRNLGAGGIRVSLTDARITTTQRNGFNTVRTTRRKSRSNNKDTRLDGRLMKHLPEVGLKNVSLRHILIRGVSHDTRALRRLTRRISVKGVERILRHHLTQHRGHYHRGFRHKILNAQGERKASSNITALGTSGVRNLPFRGTYPK